MPDKSQKSPLPLTQMKAGQSGTVVKILGGFGATRRLEALGIRVGKKITKISAMFMRGPVTVKVGQTSLAIGHGLAHKVMVEVQE